VLQPFQREPTPAAESESGESPGGAGTADALDALAGAGQRVDPGVEQQGPHPGGLRVGGKQLRNQQERNQERH